MPADVEAKAQAIKDAISNGEYFAFTGPLKDNTGKLQLAEALLLTMHTLTHDVLC